MPLLPSQRRQISASPCGLILGLKHWLANLGAKRDCFGFFFLFGPVPDDLYYIRDKQVKDGTRLAESLKLLNT